MLFAFNPQELVATDALASALPLVATAANATNSTNTTLTFGLDHVEWFQGSLLGNPLWQYLAALIYVVLAFYASKFLDYLIQIHLRKLTAKTKTQGDDLILKLVSGPVKIIAFVILLRMGLRVFAWPDWAETFISNALKIVVASSLTYVVLKFVDLAMGLWQKRIEAAGEAVLDIHLVPVIRKSLKVFVVIVTVLVTSQNIGMNVTGLLASLSIGGLAVGLAAQDTLSNLFGAVALFADKPFLVGDRIQLDSIDGIVESIGSAQHAHPPPGRASRHRSQSDDGQRQLTNVSQRPNIKTVMNIGITYDTPPEKIERANADHQRHLPATSKDRRPHHQLQQVREFVAEHPGRSLVGLARTSRNICWVSNF